ncbi:SRPBCC family protein [Hoyosella altamirensis]|uniref:SRPBCC family protein n=1 Tax=Hoyosella altamirensis TaxID=616997 RepID=A0A839RNJ4_9ACTN|nr:SRPBCC family protein [Hoyosella altamirensis]MBB3038060.1 hypothetical protein [Hoyosella altamirensis]
MKTLFSLEEVDMDFLAAAPYRYEFITELPAQIDDVWAGLAGDAPLSWCKLVKDARYTTGRPFGPGTIRQLTLMPGLVTVEEKFFLWDETPGKRYEHAFSVVKSSAPGLKRFGEATLLEATESGTRLTWTFGIEPQLPLRPALPLANPALRQGFKSLVTDTEKYYAK